MQLAHIVPKKYASLAIKNSGFLFVESALLEDVPYMEQARAAGKSIVIDVDLDAYPPGNFTLLLGRAQQQGISEIICPHVSGDGTATMGLTGKFLQAHKATASDIKLMAVPEGSGYNDYENCFFEFLALQDIFTTYGLPAGTLGQLGGDFTGIPGVYPNRLEILRRKIMSKMKIGMWECCLLEIGNAGAQELQEVIGRFSQITRCITASAFGAAIEDRDLAKEGREFEAANLDFNAEFIAEDSEALLPLAFRNMQYLNEFARSIGAPAV